MESTPINVNSPRLRASAALLISSQTDSDFTIRKAAKTLEHPNVEIYSLFLSCSAASAAEYEQSDREVEKGVLSVRT